MTFYCLRSAAILLTLSAYGCATPFTSIPKSDGDFRLPPQEFAQKFTDVRAFSAEYGSAPVFAFPVVDDLVSGWGPPDQTTIDRKWQIRQAANIEGIVLWLSGGAPELLLPLSAFVGYLAVTQTPETLTWNKADYTVDVHTIQQGASKRVLYWDWRHTAAGVSAPVLAPKTGMIPIVKFDFYFGPQFFDSNVDAADPEISKGVSWAVGVRHPGLIPHTDTELSVGWRFDFNFDSDANRKIIVRSIPVEALAMYRLDQSWVRVGGGASIHLNGKLDSNVLPDEKIDPGIGIVAQADFSLGPRSQVGVRVDRRQYETTSGREVNATSLGLTHTSRF